MPLYKIQDDEVMVLQERVAEAQRLVKIQTRRWPRRRRRRRAAVANAKPATQTMTRAWTPRSRPDSRNACRARKADAAVVDAVVDVVADVVAEMEEIRNLKAMSSSSNKLKHQS